MGTKLVFRFQKRKKFGTELTVRSLWFFVKKINNHVALVKMDFLIMIIRKKYKQKTKIRQEVINSFLATQMTKEAKTPGISAHNLGSLITTLRSVHAATRVHCTGTAGHAPSFP